MAGATAVHAGLAMLLVWGSAEGPGATPMAAGFEMVRLAESMSSSGATNETPDPDPPSIEPARPEPEPVPEPIPEPEPEPEPVPEPEPEPVPEPVPNTEADTPPDTRDVQRSAESPPPLPAPAATAPHPPVDGQRDDPADAYTPPTAGAAYLDNPKPVYPMAARRRGMEGVVRLEVEVSAHGLPLAVRVLEGSGFRILDASARDAVKGWRFEPARRMGRPVAATVEVPIRFTLENG